MKVKELMSLLEGISEEAKESPLLGQAWSPQNGSTDSYYEITSLSIVYEMVEYAKDGDTARSGPPNVILVHNPNVNNPKTVADNASASRTALSPNLW